MARNPDTHTTIVDAVKEITLPQRPLAAHLLASLVAAGYEIELGGGDRQEYVNVRKPGAKSRTMSMDRNTGRVRLQNIKARDIAVVLGVSPNAGKGGMSFAITDTPVATIFALVIAVDEITS